MTNYEYLKSLTEDGLAKYLAAATDHDLEPWHEWFGSTYCENCESVMCKYEDGAKEFPCSWCELHDWKCKFFPDYDETPSDADLVKIWLESEH